MASRLPIPQDELKKILFEAKIVKEEEWKEAEDNAHRRRRGVEEVLIERGFLNSRYLYELISDKLKVPFINLRKRKLDHEVLNIIDEIEKVRSGNNMNWMDILRLAFTHAPKDAKELMKKIDHEDNRISELVKKLSK